MSRRTSEANKAIATAWDIEKQRVSEGKGTRDWTQQQQQDILDKGKAYDDNGRAFEGQHMKSVEKYPEYQGHPQNIQFLTKQEHLEAHLGNWQNPTNWYYDPVSKQFTDFGEDMYIPCSVMELSEPIVPRSNFVQDPDVQCDNTTSGDVSADEHKANSSPPPENPPVHENREVVKSKVTSTSNARIAVKQKRGFWRSLWDAVKVFPQKHPIITSFGGAIILNAVLRCIIWKQHS